jgi:hypothetical protein
MEVKNLQGGRWRFFEKPNHENLYVMGLDTASGKEKANETAACLLNVHTGRQAAVFAGKYTPELVAIEVEKVGRLFYHKHKDNPVEIAVEREYHGMTVINKLLEMKYPRIYYHEWHHASTETASSKWGWDAQKYRQMAIDWLTEDIGFNMSPRPEDKRRAVWVDDPETHSQLLTFERNDKTGKFQAVSGKYDDRVSALYIANFVRRERLEYVLRPEVVEEAKDPTKADYIMAGSPKDGERPAGPREMTE